MNEHDRHLDLSWLVSGHPENEEAKKIPRSDTSAGRQMIWDIMVSIAEDPSHEYGCDASTIVSLRGEIDNRDNSPDKNV
jgi:hypothetical protein